MAEEEQLDCDYSTLLIHKTAGTACEFVTKYCADEIETINFYHLRFCTLPESFFGYAAFTFLCILTGAVAFFLLGQIASTYLTPVLTKISIALNMSETLSGVTLLAFANGAPDIISSFSAGGSEGGLFISIGNLFGAGLFCSTLVIGRCIQVSRHTIQMEKDQWNRDLVFYVLASLLLLVYGMIGSITYVMAGGFFVIYLVYISIVIYQDRQSKAAESDALFETRSLEKQHEVDTNKLKNKFHHLAKNEDISDSVTSSMIEAGVQPAARKLTLTMAEVKKIYKEENQVAAEEEESENPVLKVLTFPLKLVPSATIPNLDEEGVKHPLIFLTPLSASLLVTFFLCKMSLAAHGKWFFNFTSGAYVLAVLVGLPFSVLVKYLRDKGNEAYQWILVPFALVASILFLKTSAGSIVDIINFIADNFNVNKVLLGATLLGIGNTLADFFANSSLAATGYGVMACTGSIAGQLFNLLMSIPLNIFNSLNQSNKSAEPFDLYDFSGKEKTTKIFAVTLIFLVIFQLINILYMSIFNEYVLTKKLAQVNVVVYVVCFVGFFLMEFMIPKDAQD
jgi:solute carrier family 24 (sodium/potassium/calcium exchanger), member 6